MFTAKQKYSIISGKELPKGYLYIIDDLVQTNTYERCKMDITDCQITKDLVNNHRRHNMSAESQALVKNHLKSCKKCRRKYSSFTNAVFIALLSAGTLLWILFLIISFSLIGYKPVQHKTGKRNYEYVDESFVFPTESVVNKARKVKYDKRSHTYFWGDDYTCSILLQCTFDDSDYQAEISRLDYVKTLTRNSSWTFTPESEEEREERLQIESNFSYPVFIKHYNYGWDYNYALLTGDHEITYIHLFNCKSPHFDQSYLPMNYGESD